MNLPWLIKATSGGGLLTPAKHRTGVRMRAVLKENNRRINRLRSVVERVIAPVLTWRVLHSGFRRPPGSLMEGVFFCCGGLVFLRLGPLMNKPHHQDPHRQTP